MKDEVARALLVQLTNTPDLHAYAARAMFRSLSANGDSASPILVCTAVWVIGEYGEMLLPELGGPLLPGEAPLPVSEADVSAGPRDSGSGTWRGHGLWPYG